MRDLDSLWAQAKVRAVVWRAEAVIDALRRIEAATAKPPVKTVKRRETPRQRAAK